MRLRGEGGKSRHGEVGGSGLTGNPYAEERDLARDDHEARHRNSAKQGSEKRYTCHQIRESAYAGEGGNSAFLGGRKPRSLKTRRISGVLDEGNSR